MSISCSQVSSGPRQISYFGLPLPRQHPLLNFFPFSKGKGFYIAYYRVRKAETLIANKGLSSQSYGFSSCHVWM